MTKWAVWVRQFRTGNRYAPMSPSPCYILAPYVATTPDVVERMIAFAGVTAADRVLDLGCGDGRLAIAAAQCGAQAVGVDIEPYWIGQAHHLAEQAGVTPLTRFVHQDALAIDCRDFSVVFLYLVEWSTHRVAAHLISQCRPGTRVVSNNFPFPADMGADTEHFTDADGQHRQLHRLVVPEAS